MEKIFICNNTNCRRRLLDANKIQLYFEENNYPIVHHPKDADIIIFVTCAYRNEITNDALDKIKELQAYSAELIIAGCLPEIEKERLSEVFNGKSLSTKNIQNIDDFFPNNMIGFSEIKDADAILKKQGICNQEDVFSFKKLPLLGALSNQLKVLFTKYFLDPHLLVYLYPTKKDFYHIRISWGCKGNCSYCGIKKAIGQFKSKSLKECVQDFNKGLEHGYKKMVITADDVGAYGTDSNSSFPELLREFISIKGDFDISIQDFDPKWAVKYIDELEVIFKDPRIKSVNIALQNGSERILKLMNRYSDVKKIGDTLHRLKRSNPSLSLDTHFIIGFPGETDEDFIQTMDFVKEVDFDMGFIYRYSPKTGTKAAAMKQTDENIIIDYLNKAQHDLKEQKYNVIQLSKNSFYTFYK